MADIKHLDVPVLPLAWNVSLDASTTDNGTLVLLENRSNDVLVVPLAHTPRNASTQTNESPRNRHDNHTATRTKNPTTIPRQNHTHSYIDFPVLVVSLPKSGTTSLHRYFNCNGGRRSTHTFAKNIRIGKCLQDNIREERPPFQDCQFHFQVFTDIGYAREYGCFFPQIDALEHVAHWYPNATILLSIRNATEWYTSLSTYHGGKLSWRWRHPSCNATHMPKEASSRLFQDFYEWHIQHVRAFVQRHPSLRYIEVQLESPETGPILEAAFGIPASCWTNCAPNRPECY